MAQDGLVMISGSPCSPASGNVVENRRRSAEPPFVQHVTPLRAAVRRFRQQQPGGDAGVLLSVPGEMLSRAYQRNLQVARMILSRDFVESVDEKQADVRWSS